MNNKLPEGWKEVKLGEVCDVRDGTHDSPKYISKGFPLITSKNLKNGFIDFSEVNLISKEDYDNVNKRSKVNLGDILMPMIGTIGNPIIVKEKREFAIKNVALIKFNNKNVLNRYVRFLLNSNYFKYLTDKVNRGGTQKFIALKDIRNFLIPLPPLETQKQIVSILEKAENAKEWRKETDKLTKELLKSIFLEMFGNPLKNPKKWNTKELRYIATISRGKFSPRPRNDPKYFNGPYPFIQTGDIANSNHFLKNFKQTLNQLGTKVSKLFNKETIVIAIVGATIGETAILKIDTYATDSVIGIVPDMEYLNTEYLEYVLRFWKPIFKEQAPEVARPNINIGTLKPVTITLPPLELQNKFASIVKEVEAMKEQQKQSKNQIDNLFNALIQKAFKGELVV